MKIAEVIPKLAEIEAKMGQGGSEIIEITKHKIETIGTVMNDWGAIRVDPKGKMENAYVNVHDAATYTIRKASPLIEQVHVDDLPGGTYTLNVCNRYNVLVGAGGINFKSYGIVNISGAMTNIAGEQVNIGSANEVNIDGGRRLALVGDIVHIKQRHGEQVLLDGSVGITGNLYVKGSIYTEGHLGAQSISYPPTIQQSHPISITHGPTPNQCTGVSIPVDQGGQVDSTSNELTPGGGTFLYMGYTDPGTKVGWVPSDTVNKIGIIKSGTSLNINNISGILDSKGGACTVSGIASITLADDVEVYSTGFAVEGTGPEGNADSPKSDGKVQTTKPNKVLSLRGLPPDEVKKLVSATNSAQGAVSFPVMNMGVGANADVHKIPTFTVSYTAGGNSPVGSHQDVRKQAQSNPANGPGTAYSNDSFSQTPPSNFDIVDFASTLGQNSSITEDIKNAAKV